MAASRSTPVTCHFVTFDGNGNIMALITASDGSETARYEYGPFGELRHAGPWADQRFGVEPYGVGATRAPEQRQ